MSFLTWQVNSNPIGPKSNIIAHARSLQYAAAVSLGWGSRRVGNTVPRTPWTVCIIEDDQSVRRALWRLIRSLGLTVQTFVSAEEFLRAGPMLARTCLIVDLHLPGMSGLELQEQLKAEGKNVPIVFITGYGDEHVREQALQAGAIAFLEKPFAEQALVEAVQRALG